MSKVGELCEVRFCELALEPGGQELLHFFSSPSDAAQLQTDILRQDHPKVLNYGTLKSKGPLGLMHWQLVVIDCVFHG
jgi:hypothetical protein